MILSGILIKKFIDDDRLWCAYRDGQSVYSHDLVVGSNSVDVSLSSEFTILRAKRQCSPVKYWIDPSDPSTVEVDRFCAEELILRPGDFYLAKTRESFDSSALVYVDATVPMYFVQMYDGRSTMARLGMISHCTAGFGDRGYNQPWTLELANLGNNPILLKKGMRIGQVSFHAIAGSMVDTYNRAYNTSSVYPTVELGEDRV